jgi:hypothetical protein
MNTLSPAQQTYLERLNAIEAERNAALQKPGADADRLNVAMLRRMSTELVKLRATQLETAQ